MSEEIKTPTTTQSAPASGGDAASTVTPTASGGDAASTVTVTPDPTLPDGRGADTSDANVTAVEVVPSRLEQLAAAYRAAHECVQSARATAAATLADQDEANFRHRKNLEELAEQAKKVFVRVNSAHDKALFDLDKAENLARAAHAALTDHVRTKP